MNTTFTKRSGFSMIELVFVIVILGVLAAVAVPRFVATRTDAQVATARSDMAAAQKAIVAKVFADNIDTTQKKAPDPNRAVASQTTFNLTWSEWIMQVAGLDGSRWGVYGNAAGDMLANEVNPVFGGAPIGWCVIADSDDAVAPIGNVSRNDIATVKAGKGMCGPVLGIATGGGKCGGGGFMIFNPSNAMMPYKNSSLVGLMNNGGANNFCYGFSKSYQSSNSAGNKVVPLASTGTIEF